MCELNTVHIKRKYFFFLYKPSRIYIYLMALFHKIWNDIFGGKYT